MTTIMHLYKKPFDDMVSGSKTYELRLYDDKRKLLKRGDRLTFICKIYPNVRINAEISKLTISKEFKDFTNGGELNFLRYTYHDRLSLFDAVKIDLCNVTVIEIDTGMDAD